MSAVTVFQRYTENINITLTDPTDDQDWVAFGSENTDDILAALVALLPSSYKGLYLTSYNPEHAGAGWWNVRVHYTHEIPLLPLNIRFSGETTGKTLHREQSLETVNKYSSKPGNIIDTVPDYGGLIGVTEDNVTGVDVITPGFTFTVERRFNAALLASDFLATVASMTGMANNGPVTVNWKGQMLFFHEKELLFHGAGVSDPGRDVFNNEQIQLSYKFEYSPNRNDIEIGNMVGIEKKGWEYLWIRYVKKIDPNSNVLVKTPDSVYIEQVVYYGDFSQLNFLP